MARQSIAVAAAVDRSPPLVSELRAAVRADDGEESPALWLVVAELLPELQDQLASLAGAAPVLVVSENLVLASLLEVMRDDARIVGVASARDGVGTVVALARMLLDDAASGSILVTDAASSRAAIVELRTAAIAAGITGARVDAVEQCADELLTNALYAAPIDATGASVFAARSPRERLDLQTEHAVSVGHARDGSRFMLSVRDAFGSLDRRRVLDRLHGGGIVERKVAGAGLGLSLVAREANGLVIDVVPGASTTITCVFDAGRSGPASRFALQLHPPVTQRAHARAVRTPAARRRRRARAVGVGTAMMLVLAILLSPASGSRIAIVTTPPDATVEINGWVATRDRAGRAVTMDLPPLSRARIHAYRRGYAPARDTVALTTGPRSHTMVLAPLPTLLVNSEPPGATVEIAGAVLGTTPATITSLPPGDRVDVSLVLPGYQRATAQLVVPASGETSRHSQSLTRDPSFTRARIVSDPPGARVVRVGDPPSRDRSYTPLEVMVPRGASTKFVVEMPGRVPLHVAVEPDALEGTERGGALAAGVAVRVEGRAGTTVSVAAAPHCQHLTVPAECTLAPGTYELAVTADATTTRTVVVASEALTIQL